MVIYLIRNTLNGKAYVGQTIHTVEKRFHEHVSAARQGSMYPLHCAIRKHGAENFVVSVLSECTTADELDKEEIRLIEELDCRKSGYNLALGGHGVRGKGIWTHSDETKRKISELNRGRVRTEDVKRRIRESVKKSMTDERREFIRSRTREALSDPEKRKKISTAQKMTWSDPEKIEESRNLNCKGVSQFTLTGEHVMTYRSVREAVRQTGINHGNICTCARGGKRTAGGFVWKYSTDLSGGDLLIDTGMKEDED